MDEKQVLITLGNVRIIRYDKLNVEVQTEKILPAGEYRKPGKDGGLFVRETDVKTWETWGYYPFIEMALREIFKRGILIDEKQRELSEYLKAMDEIEKRLERCINKLN